MVTKILNRNGAAVQKRKKPARENHLCQHEWHMASCRKCGKERRPLKSLSDKYKPYEGSK